MDYTVKTKFSVGDWVTPTKFYKKRYIEDIMQIIKISLSVKIDEKNKLYHFIEPQYDIRDGGGIKTAYESMLYITSPPSIILSFKLEEGDVYLYNREEWMVIKAGIDLKYSPGGTMGAPSETREYWSITAINGEKEVVFYQMRNMGFEVIDKKTKKVTWD